MFLGSRVEFTWPLVPRVAAVTCDPGFAPEIPVMMPAHCVWLKVLKVSRRNWVVMRSEILVFLNSEMSQLLMPGPYKMPFPVVPRDPLSGRANTRGLKYSSRDFLAG